MAIPLELPEARTLSDDESRRRAVAALAQRAGRKGYAIARDLLADPMEAEDAVQESLARAWRADLRDPAALDAWFYRVLTNHCLRSLRRRKLTGVFRRLWAGAEIVDDDLLDPAPRADEALGRGRDIRAVLEGIHALPAQQKACLVLRYGHDLGVPEIAAMLGVGEGSVKTHLVRGLARLRERLGGGR